MKKSDCIKFFNMIIDSNGRPTTEQLVKNFNSYGKEMSKELYIGKFAVYTDSQLVQMAKRALNKIN